MSHLQFVALDCHLTATAGCVDGPLYRLPVITCHPAATLRHLAQCTDSWTVKGRAARLTGHLAAHT